jgi:hypothetical protein
VSYTYYDIYFLFGYWYRTEGAEWNVVWMFDIGFCETPASMAVIITQCEGSLVDMALVIEIYFSEGHPVGTTSLVLFEA